MATATQKSSSVLYWENRSWVLCQQVTVQWDDDECQECMKRFAQVMKSRGGMALWCKSSFPGTVAPAAVRFQHSGHSMSTFVLSHLSNARIMSSPATAGDPSASVHFLSVWSVQCHVPFHQVPHWPLLSPSSLDFPASRGLSSEL